VMVKGVCWRYRKELILYSLLFFFRRVQMATFLPAIIFLCLLVAVVFLLAVIYCVLQRFPYCCDSKSCVDDKDSDSESSSSEQEEQDLGDEKDVDEDGKVEKEKAAVQQALEEVVVHQTEHKEAEEDNKVGQLLEEVRIVVDEKEENDDHEHHAGMRKSVTLSTPNMKNNDSIGKTLFSKFLKPPMRNNTDLPRYGSTMDSPLSERSISMRSFFSSTSMLSTNTGFTGGKSFCTSELLPVYVQALVVYDEMKETLSVGVKHLECEHGNSITLYWQGVMEIFNCYDQDDEDNYPGINRHGKVKTKYKPGSNPMFNKNFEVENIEKTELEHFAIKYSIFVRVRARAARKRLVGTAQVSLSELSKEHTNTIFEWKEIIDPKADDWLL